MSRKRFQNGTKNNNTPSHILLDHCYVFVAVHSFPVWRRFWRRDPRDLFLPALDLPVGGTGQKCIDICTGPWILNIYQVSLTSIQRFCIKRQKRSTEGCSKFKSPETRQVLERLVSTLEHMQVPKWDRTRCPSNMCIYVHVHSYVHAKVHPFLHGRGFNTRNAHLVHIINQIRFKMVYTS